MDINNNQQINTFSGGMDTDTSDMYLGEGKYRYAENVRVVTDNDNNSGELHIIDGTTPFHQESFGSATVKNITQENTFYEKRTVEYAVDPLIVPVVKMYRYRTFDGNSRNSGKFSIGFSKLAHVIDDSILYFEKINTDGTVQKLPKSNTYVFYTAGNQIFCSENGVIKSYSKELFLSVITTDHIVGELRMYDRDRGASKRITEADTELFFDRSYYPIPEQEVNSKSCMYIMYVDKQSKTTSYVYHIEYDTVLRKYILPNINGDFLFYEDGVQIDTEDMQKSILQNCELVRVSEDESVKFIDDERIISPKQNSTVNNITELNGVYLRGTEDLSISTARLDNSATIVCTDGLYTFGGKIILPPSTLENKELSFPANIVGDQYVNGAISFNVQYSGTLSIITDSSSSESVSIKFRANSQQEIHSNLGNIQSEESGSYSKLQITNNVGGTYTIFSTTGANIYAIKFSIDGESLEYNTNGKLLGMTSVRNLAVFVIKQDSQWIVTTLDDTGKIRLIAGPFTERIWPIDWDGKEKPLSLVTRWEADDNIKLYIADGIHTLMQVNLAEENQGTSFEEIFQSSIKMLMPIVAEIGSSKGASIPGVVLQYGYITYKKRGQSSTLSVLSNELVQSIDNVNGYEVDQNGSSVVKLTLPEDSIGKNVRIYRIAYSRSGQLPRVDMIYDQLCTQNVLIDTGQSLENISTAEFIATNKLSMVPKVLESKNDYLFEGNVIYNQDEIDSQFASFDARCYSKGSYYSESGQKHDIGNNLTDEEMLIIPKDGLGQYQFDTQEAEYQPQNWLMNSDGYNGHGICFDWKYKYRTDTLYVDKQYGENITSAPRTYGRNEVYRFGVRLYDNRGRASSVKWIADIKMPDYFNPTGDESMKPYMSIGNSNDQYGPRSWNVNNISIEFTPRNTAKYWRNVYKYEILQAKRGVNDYYKLAQGLIGYPTDISNSELCVPYFLTTQRFEGLNCTISRKIGLVGYTNLPYINFIVPFPLSKSEAMFICPEYTYQPDDMKALIDSNKKLLYYKNVAIYGNYPVFFKHTLGLPIDTKYQEIIDLDPSNSSRALVEYEPNGAEIILNNLYRTGWDADEDKGIPAENHVTDFGNRLTVCALGLYNDTNSQSLGTELKVGIYRDKESSKQSEYDGIYYLNQQIMAYFNPRCNEKATLPILGLSHGDNHIKKAYFTNLFPQKVILGDTNSQEYLNFKDALLINEVTYYDAEDPDHFAKSEDIKYRDYFKNTKNGKKFFNYACPGTMHKGLWDVIKKSIDTYKDAYKRSLMSAYDENGWAGDKFKWSIEPPSWDHEEEWEAYRDNVSNTMWAMPLGVGGPGIILEIGADEHKMFPSTFRTPSTDYADGTDNTDYSYPPMTIGNIYKPATPYGGYSLAAINATQYVSEGFISDPTETPVDVNMGDNHITAFVYFLYHNYDNALINCIKSAALQYILPIESTMDLTNQCSKYVQATHSKEFDISADGDGSARFIQVRPGTNGGRFTQGTDLYLYNTAYSIHPDVVTYSAEDTVNASSSKNDSRVHYSLKKQNNELIDNWGNFKAIDYLDVDTRYGEITGLKLFKDKLIFLQENGAGVLSVNDRIILKDQSSANIIVGNGGVLDRYDYFTTMYGMKPNQQAWDTSNDALYWWDGHRKEIISYVDGYNVSLLQRLKNVQNYINTNEESDTPTILYDVDNKEVLFNVVNNEALVYNEQTLNFTSIYTFCPIYYCNLNGTTLITKAWSNDYSGIHLYNTTDGTKIQLFGNDANPKIEYVVNKDSVYNKVFDIQTFGGRFYKGDTSDLKFEYKTPLKQLSRTDGSSVTDREYDYRLAIPRNNDDMYGGRMRGKTMQCSIESKSNDIDFSIQYITTKYRMSWS